MDQSIVTPTEGLNRLLGMLHRHADRKPRLSVSLFTHSLTVLKLNENHHASTLCRMGTHIFVYTVDLGQLRADKQKLTTLGAVGLKVKKIQISIVLEFCGALANTACSNTREAKSRQQSLHVGTPPTVIATENINKPSK